nr:unnamed protein product [Callosobruchus chinensis]
MISRLRGILEKVHMDLDKETSDFLNAHHRRVKDKQKLHDELKVRDEAMQKVLQTQLDHIRKSMDRIRAMKIRLRESQKQLGRRVADLDNEHAFFLNAFNLLKRKLIVDRAVDFQKLQTLTVSFDATKQTLEKLQKRGKRGQGKGNVSSFIYPCISLTFWKPVRRAYSAGSCGVQKTGDPRREDSAVPLRE